VNRQWKTFAKYLLKSSFRRQIEDLLDRCGEHTVNTPPHRERSIELLTRQETDVGVFSDYIAFLPAIECSIRKGRIPVVDRKTVHNAFLSDYKDANTWEFYFEQPCGIGLDDLHNESDDIVRSFTSANVPVSLSDCRDETTVAYWRQFARRYIRPTPTLRQQLTQTEQALFPQGARVLGVSIREGYAKLFQMNSRIAAGHPFQASTEQLLADAEKRMEQWGCDRLLVTCQTDETVERFRRAFGEQCLYVDRPRYTFEELPEGEHAKKPARPIDQRQNELDYIREIYLLSRCTSFLCSRNSGSEAAFIMSDGYEHFYCYDLGLNR